MTRRSLLFNDDDTEFLFMIRTPDDVWHVDLTMLELWYNTPDPINIYRTDATDNFVAIHPTGAITHWTYLPITEYPEIRSLVQRPWIPSMLIYATVPPEEIYDFDSWSRAGAITAAVPAHWQEIFRPRLCDTAPPPLPTPYLLTAPVPDTTTTTTTALLPPHVAAILIAAAATCPITLEPIDPTDATVTSCGHVFTASALGIWLRTRNHCPECRRVLL
jgi:hypothetical protein